MAIKSDPVQAKLDIQTPEQSREELQAELLAVLIDEERKEAEIKGLKYTLSQKKSELEGLVLKRRETMMKLENGQVIFNVNANADSRDDDDTDDDLDADYPSDDELNEYDDHGTPEAAEEATKLLPGEIVDEGPFGVAEDEAEPWPTVKQLAKETGTTTKNLVRQLNSSFGMPVVGSGTPIEPDIAARVRERYSNVAGVEDTDDTDIEDEETEDAA